MWGSYFQFWIDSAAIEVLAAVGAAVKHVHPSDKFGDARNENKGEPKTTTVRQRKGNGDEKPRVHNQTESVSFNGPFGHDENDTLLYSSTSTLSMAFVLVASMTTYFVFMIKGQS